MAIASAEAIEPEIYVMDEPSANLDTDSTERLGNTIRKLKEKGKTILIAEHRLYYLMPIADRFLYIKDGRINLRRLKSGSWPQKKSVSWV